MQNSQPRNNFFFCFLIGDKEHASSNSVVDVAKWNVSQHVLFCNRNDINPEVPDVWIVTNL